MRLEVLALALPPTGEGRQACAAFWREVGGGFIADLGEGPSVQACDNEGAQFRVGVDLSGDAASMRAAVARKDFLAGWRDS